MTLERRTFLKLTTIAGAGAATALGTASAASLAEPAPVALGSGEMALLKQLLARMLPADESGGGAVEAGAHVYIDRALGGYHARHLGTYRRAIAAIDGLIAEGNGPAEARIDGVLTALEAGQAGKKFEDGGKAFFGLLRTHMLEGTLGDPSYGGNRDYLGWQMIGYPGVNLVVSAAEQAVDGPRSQITRSMETFGGKAQA